MWQRKQWDTARMEMHCAPYYICAFRPKTGAHPNHGEEGQGRTLCLGYTLLLWIFICICQKFVIICIMLFLPLVQVISEHYMNAPSQLPKADELQDTAADIFKHHCPFSTQRALGYLWSTCMHSRVSAEAKTWEPICWANRAFRWRERSEQQWLRQRQRNTLPNLCLTELLQYRLIVWLGCAASCWLQTGLGMETWEGLCTSEGVCHQIALANVDCEAGLRLDRV